MINEIKSIQVEGTLVHRFDTQHPSDRFRYREMVLEVNTNIDGNSSVDHLKMRLIQENCDLLDELRNGYRLVVTFKITGFKYKRKIDGETGYITNLEVLNIDVIDDAHNFEKDIPIPSAPKPEDDPIPDVPSNDLPF
jgi:hypothetical protein